MSERVSVGAPVGKSKLIDQSLIWGCALSVAVGLSSGLGGSLGISAAMAQGEALPLRKVSVDAGKNLVFEFATGAAKPAQPVVRELPAPQHRLVFDFPGAAVDTESMPSVDQLSEQLRAALPGILSARYSMVAKAKVPTFRMVLEISPTAKAEPRLVRHEEGAVVLSLGRELAEAAAPVAASAPVEAAVETANAESTAGQAAPTASSAPAPAPAQSTAAAAPTDAYEAYYKAFQAQSAEVKQETGGSAEWGPRKGSLNELNNGRGIKPLVTNTALAAPRIEPNLEVELPAKAKPAVNAFAEAEANKARAEQAAAETAAAPTAPTPAPVAQVESPRESVSEPAAVNSAPAPAPGGEAEKPAATMADTSRETAETTAKEAPAPEATAENSPTAVEENSSSETNTAAAETESAAVKARRLFNNAVKAHLSGKLTEAIAGYKSALAVDSELGDAHSNLGLAYNQQHNYASALTEFRKALALNPKDAITYNGIGAALRAEKDIPGAIKNWEAAVKLDSHLAVAHYNLGTAYEAQGELEKALVSYESAIRNDPRLGEAYYRIGLIMQKRHRVEEAREHYKKALKVSENSDYSEDAKLRLASLDKKVK